MEAAQGSRRERLREETLREIKETARRQLVAQGPAGIALRAIAREMGMTAPALYRYYASFDQLIAALTADYYDELVAAMESARDVRPAGDLGGRLLAASRAFRFWSVDHPAEFGLIFGAPLPGFSVPPDSAPERAALRFSEVFQSLFVKIWVRQKVPVPQRGAINARLGKQLTAFASAAGLPLPVPAIYVFLACWVRIYGAVAMEVFGHLRWALDDGSALFETELRLLAEMLGIAGDYRPPPATRSR